ncbi:MAG: hypothetical protein JSS96_08485 [Bacteroidetes bacterium]|nr:hypothetical protein [Bacteroidota bacterium]
MFHKLTLTLLISACCFAACQKSGKTPPPVPTASLSIVMRHQGSTSVIDSAMFYIAPISLYSAPSYGFTYAMPGFKSGNRTIGTFTGLLSDSVYIYGRAYDNSLHTHIDGGRHYRISAPSSDTIYLDMADTTGTYPIFVIVQ